MWRVSIASLALAGFCVGCTSVPSLDPVYKLSLAHIVDRVQCELRDAIKPHRQRHRWLSGWDVTVELTMKVDAESVVATDSTFGPFNSGRFTFGVGADVATTASRNATLKFTSRIRDILGYNCQLPPASGIQLDSDLGIADWVQRVLDALDASDTKRHVDSFGQIISFEVKLKGSLTPKFMLVQYVGPGSVSGERTDAHTLNMAFAAPETSGKPNRTKLDSTLQNQQLQLLLPQRRFIIR